MNNAVESAKKAYESWKNTSVLTRQALMLKYQALIREHSVSTIIIINSSHAQKATINLVINKKRKSNLHNSVFYFLSSFINLFHCSCS